MGRERDVVIRTRAWRVKIPTSDFAHIELVAVWLMRAGGGLEGLNLRRVGGRIAEGGLVGQRVSRSPNSTGSADVECVRSTSSSAAMSSGFSTTMSQCAPVNVSFTAMVGRLVRVVWYGMVHVLQVCR